MSASLCADALPGGHGVAATKGSTAQELFTRWHRSVGEVESNKRLSAGPEAVDGKAVQLVVDAGAALAQVQHQAEYEIVAHQFAQLAEAGENPLRSSDWPPSLRCRSRRRPRARR